MNYLVLSVTNLQMIDYLDHLSTGEFFEVTRLLISNYQQTWNLKLIMA